MNDFRSYIFEYLLIFAVMAASVAGFWNIYFGVDADPTSYQTFHVITVFLWLFLLLYQLTLIGSMNI